MRTRSLTVEEELPSCCIRMTTEAKQVHNVRTDPLLPPSQPKKSMEQIISEFDVSTLPVSHRKSVLKIISDYSEVFQSDLPGYNNEYGPVYANFEFASKARPTPQKLRAPAYGSHGAMLFNIKCQEMEEKGILINPMD